MDDLPPHLLLEILSRLTDSADLARSRLVSKTFDSLSREVRSINFVCTLCRYLKSRSPETRHLITPFKTIFNSLVNNSSTLESVSIGVAKALCGISYDDIEDESDDLYLTDVAFVNQWLPQVCRELRSLSISDFWIQSCWRRSEILALLSSCCHHLVDLEVKNAWLSVDGLNPMPMLTSLTLESIRLDDEDLSKVNHCFPYLQVLNLIGVGGLKEPKIHLYHLRMCRWTVSNAPHSLTILAPNLLKLELKCIEPRSLVLETPSLSNFYLSLRRANKFEVKKLIDLKILQLESSNLCGLLYFFPSDNSIKRLTVDSLKFTEPDNMTMLSMERLFDAFPKLSLLYLRSGAWSEMETCFLSGGLRSHTGMKGVKEIVAQLVIHDAGDTSSFIFAMLDKCTNLSDVGLLIHREVDPNIVSNLISRCTAEHPKVRWRWGMWKEGSKDAWISDGI
ncbi:F-box/LRR-repeat protein At4g29420 [Euphorbia lathyris]|uniref:F-box/LRR-repeat protein At4g29420 n=1 Tax=Euphorbia lathyris TaxID=212925 RepID=UPI0033131F73